MKNIAGKHDRIIEDGIFIDNHGAVGGLTVPSHKARLLASYPTASYIKEGGMKKLMLVVVIVCSMAGSALAFQSDILDSLDGGSGGPSGNMQDWDWGQCPGSVN